MWGYRRDDPDRCTAVEETDGALFRIEAPVNEGSEHKRGTLSGFIHEEDIN